MNKVILSGNLCKEIELRFTTNNIAVLSNTIAVKNEYKNDKGEYESTFINFVAYRNNAEFLGKYASKGSKVLLEGKINNRNYDKEDGTKVYITEVIVDKVELLGNRKEEPAEKLNCVETMEAVTGNPFEEFAAEMENGMDLPF